MMLQFPVRKLIFIIISLLFFSCTSPDKNAPTKPLVGTAPKAPYTEVIHGTGEKELSGVIGSSLQWKSSWIDLDEPHNFKNGETVRISLGGNAKAVIVRLLSIKDDPNSPAGVVGRPVIIDENGVVIVKLDNDYNAIKQISVHGGENPWGVYPMAPGNGSPIIQHIYLTK